MARTPLLDRLLRSYRIALACEREGLSTQEGLDRAAEADARRAVSRRQFLVGMGAAAAAAAVARRARAAPPAPSASIGVVGAGLAGLVCTDELRGAGVATTLYEASQRAGGRQFSMGGAFPGPVTFPGQVVEHGGEFIDTGNTTLKGYAQEFKLTLEDVSKVPGEVFYFFDGHRVPESTVVDEFRALVPAMHDDIRLSSGAPTADAHTDYDVMLDQITLREYLDTRGAGTVVKQAIEAAYLAEYGLEIDEQNCLNWLLFQHADKRSKFTPFGVFSDERFHVVGGNQQIAAGLAARNASAIRYGMLLVRARKTSAGAIELTFREGSKTRTVVHDAVVLTIPFTVLRGVQLDASLGLPPSKLAAIGELGYGTNAKMMVGFRGPFWAALGSSGASYSLLPNHQTTWETNPSKATSDRAVLTDYSSGDRGARLDPSRVQTEASRFLGDLEKVYPGAQAAATRDSKGRFVAHLEHWPSNPLTLGSYTCYLPGQFTTLAGNEGKAVGNVFFAGEHTNSFYDWQGFMEGAALSGLDAAAAVKAALKVGALGTGA